MDSAGPPQYSTTVPVDIDGDLGTEGQPRRCSGERSLGQAGIAGLVESSCRSVLAHRHGDSDRPDLAGFYYRAGQRRRGREGEAAAGAVGRYEEAVAEWWHDRASAVYDNPSVVFWVPDPIHPSL